MSSTSLKVVVYEDGSVDIAFPDGTGYNYDSESVLATELAEMIKDKGDSDG